MKLAIVSTHPIQYYAPWFRHLASRMEFEVLYAHRQDAAGQSIGFGVAFSWDIPLLDGYPYRWLQNVARPPSVDRFGGCDCPEIEEVLLRRSFEAVLVMGWNRKVFLQAFAAARRLRLPILSRGDSQLLTPRSRFKSILKVLPYRWFLPRFNGHLYVGQRNREYLQHYGVPDRRLFFSPHFVDNRFFAENAQRLHEEGSAGRCRTDLGIESNDVVFLFVGKFIPKKRVIDLVKALERGSARGEAGEVLHAILVGDGPLRSEIERYVNAIPRLRKRVHFVGFKNQTEMPLFYAASDALVLPSDGGETWGLVVNEAMASGLPAIISDACGCAPDLIQEGVTGHTFPMGDIPTLARTMSDFVAAHRSDPERARVAVRRRIALYSIDTATLGLEQAIASLAASSVARLERN